MKPINTKKKVKFLCFYFPVEVLTGLSVKWSCRLGNEVTLSPFLTPLNSGKFENKIEMQFQFYRSKSSTLHLVKSLISFKVCLILFKVCFKYSSGVSKALVCREQIILLVCHRRKGL